MPAPSLFDLTGRIALVTGASRGLGEEMAWGLARAGAHVLINSRDEGRAKAVSDAIAADGLSAAPLAFDVSDGRASEAAFAKIDKRHGRLDILISNAAIRHRARLDDITPDDFLRVLDQNLGSMFRVGKLAGALMARGGYGRILFISSVAGMIAPYGDAAYASAKGGVNALTRAMAVDLAEAGILVNAIAPGSFLTEVNRPMLEKHQPFVERRVPLKRWGDPKEIVGPALFLVSEAASFVTGQVLSVDGGLTASFS